MHKVSVSTLPMNMSSIEFELVRVDSADYVHIDVMDGKFVKPVVFDLSEMERIQTDLVKNVHLMVDKPENVVADFALAGGDIITFHFEATKKHKKVIMLIHKAGAKAGLAINPDTKASEVKHLIHLVDHVMLMSVHPGEGGQKFIAGTIAKIKAIRKMRGDVDIEVDGGINDLTGAKCVEAGASVLCSGSYVFSFEDPRVGIDILRNV